MTIGLRIFTSPPNLLYLAFKNENNYKIKNFDYMCRPKLKVYLPQHYKKDRELYVINKFKE